VDRVSTVFTLYVFRDPVACTLLTLEPACKQLVEACPIAHGISAACLVVLDDAKASPSKRLPAATADSPVANSQSQPTFVSRQLLLVPTEVAGMPTEVAGMPAGRFLDARWAGFICRGCEICESRAQLFGQAGG
jgi:hypothetical protein